MRSSWGFYANLTHEVAENSLKLKGIHGNYLCRRSQTTPGCYTLSVRRRNDIHHFKIYNDGDTFELYGEDGFASVPDLIDYYRRNSDKFVDKDLRVVELTEPLVLEDELGPSLDQESWYFGNISHDEAQKLLCERGSTGSYLIRESRSSPGCFVLSVRNPGHTIIEFLVSFNDGVFHISTAKQLNFPTLPKLLKHYQENPIIDKATDKEIKLDEPLCETAERVRNDIRIAQEFEWLQIEDKSNTNPKTAGQMLVNKGKNRYKNILPYDLSRVVLHNVDPNIDGSDYINASYIFDDESSGLFIASQGCVKATVDHFWHMVHQENSRIVIMVTNEIEKAKIKCVRYWPDPGLTIIVDGREVSNVGETSTRDYIIREFEMEEDPLPGRQGKRVRKIYHYQFIGWPDHGVPKDPGSLLEMMALIEATQKTFQYPGPPIVHCSAGIGRTGTIIVVNMLINLYNLKGNIDEKDVPHTVQKVRCQRGGMVQTEAQYRFIYRALVFYMKTQSQLKNEAQKEQENKSEYSNLEAMNTLLRDLDVEDPIKPPLPPREG